jgi:hypothetical protein
VTRGAREVRYVRDGEERYGRDLFTHAAGKGDQWTRECEWRLPGDLDLNSLPRHTFTAVVPDEHAARELRAHIRRDVPIHVLFK